MMAGQTPQKGFFTMSKYSIYAKKLDAAYKNALEEYTAAYQKAGEDRKAAARNLETAKLHNNTAGIMRAKADDMEATAAFEEAGKRIWGEFNRQREELRAELQKELRADSTANPDAIDGNALELLKSGIMTPDDFFALLAKYDNNPTMLRLIGKYAQDAADAMTNDRAARAALVQISQACKDGQSSIMRAWEGLCTIADYCSGQSREGRTDRPEHILSMGQHWEELSSEAVGAF